MADNQIRGTESQDCPSIRVTQSDNCPSIRVRLTGGGETPEAPLSDVNFYDYDGKRVASYTAADFAALTEMPANPSHQGLTAQGWNWSLADAQAYVAAYGKLNIGQQYITDDGKTRLYINIAEPGRMSPMLRWSQTASEGVEVDWGDGSPKQTVAGTGSQSIQHTYQSIGNYTIIFDVVSGSAVLGGGGTNNPFFGPGGAANRAYTNMLKKAELGDKITMALGCFAYATSMKSVNLPAAINEIPSNCFNNCNGLYFVSIPSGVQSIGDFALSPCGSLVTAAIPKSATTMGQYIFNSDTALQSLTLPPGATFGDYFAPYCSALAVLVIAEGVTSLQDNAFGSDNSLVSVTIPSTMTSIGASALSSLRSLAELHCKSTTPPTIAANTFTNLPADCVIYVPDSAVAAYQGATNWSTYASQIVGE